MSANHDGGYSFRLCQLPAGGAAGLTEECFQQGQLDFVGEHVWIQYGIGEHAEREEVLAQRTRQQNSGLSKDNIAF